VTRYAIALQGALVRAELSGYHALAAALRALLAKEFSR
jgi:hypothetical protein